MTKAKKITFRQRLRHDAEDKLERMMESMRQHSVNVVGSFDSAINPADIMRMLCTGQTKSLRQQIITDLANEAEAEIEVIYNKQMALLPEDDDE